MQVRFDIDLLDPGDPFEIDARNEPHLYKHLPTDESGRFVEIGPSDIYEVYVGSYPMWLPAREDGAADWLMIGDVPGITLTVPLAPPDYSDANKCRPIGVYKASVADCQDYKEWLSQ